MARSPYTREMAGISKHTNGQAADITPMRVFVLGATGTIGRAAVTALADAGHDVTVFVRPSREQDKQDKRELLATDFGLPGDVSVRMGDPLDPTSLTQQGFAGESFDVLLSCMASRNGTPQDAWAVDHAAHISALDAAQRAGVQHMILLSALCVQKPRLEFQLAKLAFEQHLMAADIKYSIVRPTAFFKSLSGQFERVRNGKPYLMFGNGALTACKPISDRDLGRFLANCIWNPERWNKILPIGGPGPALTPREQGELLFRALGMKPRFKRVPLSFLRFVISVLSAVGTLSPRARDKAELARIGYYYASESMLVWDEQHQRYDADATPEFGEDTLFDHYQALANGRAKVDLGEHAVF
ncbi:MAG: NAD(P)H-binding protein [Halieaceae bacterium]|nr:NAD(P)H-binding protein [Halieaceae bacterium]